MSSEVKYDSELSINVSTVKDGENATLQCYFGFLLRSGVIIDKLHKYCNECLKLQKITRYSIRTSSGNTRGHLETKHGIKVYSEKIEKNQRKISEMLGNSNSTIVNVPIIDKRYLLARQMCLWFCRDLVPFNNSNKNGMNDFFRWAKVINESESLPNSTTLSRDALNDIYSVVYKKAQDFVKLSLPNVLGVSFDFWSDNVKRLSYINYTINWIDSDFKMQNISLKTECFPHPHTAKDIANSFSKLKTEFGLNDKTFHVTTDNGSNVKKACKLLGVEWDSCMGHDIHLLVAVDLLQHKDMENFRTLKKKLKCINKALIYKYEELKKLQDEIYNQTLFRILSELENICKYIFIK